ncbi:MAG: serine acetyltransferase [Chloroflexi bacterium]|nr:MAG: serine acetyltransferase [Chloroflexota bacterium]MBL1194375.1 serine acetyltransferase [Chloroflexota bacterium]NOH11663.1 serine acetyltransferase [Chloroflexota bacterium]
MARRDLYTRLLYARRNPLWGGLAYRLLKLLGAEVPRSVEIGEGVVLEHGGFGVVIHSAARIGSRVKIYPGVTLGRADVHKPMEQSEFKSIEVGDDVVLGPGAKVLCKEGVLKVSNGTVVGANAVLLQSTKENEVWAGVPAKKVGRRD